MDISLTDIEQAINYWRALRPSTGEEHALSPEVNALAEVYALMIYDRAKAFPETELDDMARQLIESWKSQQAR